MGWRLRSVSVFLEPIHTVFYFYPRDSLTLFMPRATRKKGNKQAEKIVNAEQEIASELKYFNYESLSEYVEMSQNPKPQKPQAGVPEKNRNR